MVKADSIIYGKIVTLDPDKPISEAMVVKDKRIVYGCLSGCRDGIV